MAASSLFQQIQTPDRSADRAHVPARSPRAAVQSRRRRAERDPVRARAGDSDVAHGPGGGDESRRGDRSDGAGDGGGACWSAGRSRSSVVLLVLATFMYRGFQEQLSSGPGYRTDHLLMMSFDPSLVRYSDEDTRRFFLQLAERGAIGAGREIGRARLVSADGRLTPSMRRTSFRKASSFRSEKRISRCSPHASTRHYFGTMGIPIVRGRGFREQDSADAPRVAIVNEQYVQHYSPNQDPIGKRFQLREREELDLGRDRRRREDHEVSLARRTAHRVRLSSVPAAPPIGHGPADRVGGRSGQPRRAASRASCRASTARMPIYNVRTMEEFYQMRTITIFNVIIGDRRRHGPDGPRPRHRRAVRPGGVRDQPADERNRHPDGHRRRPHHRPADGLAARTRAGGRRARRRAAGAAWPPNGCCKPHFPAARTGISLMAHVLVAPIVLAATFLAAYLPARRAARLDPMKALRYE